MNPAMSAVIPRPSRPGPQYLTSISGSSRSFLGGGGKGIDLIVYGALIVAIALARPEGLVSLFKRVRAPHG